MNTDAIFKRYWSALCAITDEAHGLDDGSVRLALRMAIDDTVAMTQPDDTALVTARNEAAMLRQQLATERAEVRTLIDELAEARKIDQGMAESDRRQIEVIADWMQAKEPALYHSLVGGYGELALKAIDSRDKRIQYLLGQVSDLERRLALSQAEVDRLELDMTRAVQIINMDTAQAVANNFTTQEA